MRKITEGIYQLEGIVNRGVWGANVFLLIDGKSLSLIDTGFRGRTARIIKEIKQLGYSPADIDNIIITHHHPDHIGSLALLQKASQARVVAHPADAPYIEGQLPQPGLLRPTWVRKLISPFYSLWSTVPAPVDMLVNDGDKLPILGGIKILHTPGHTPGSICLYFPEQRLVIAGDVMVQGSRVKLSAKAYTVDISQQIKSIQRIADLDFDIICFGHGPPILNNASSTVRTFAKRLQKLS